MSVGGGEVGEGEKPKTVMGAPARRRGLKGLKKNGLVEKRKRGGACQASYLEQDSRGSHSADQRSGGDRSEK